MQIRQSNSVLLNPEDISKTIYCQIKSFIAWNLFFRLKKRKKKPIPHADTRSSLICLQQLCDPLSSWILRLRIESFRVSLLLANRDDLENIFLVFWLSSLQGLARINFILSRHFYFCTFFLIWQYLVTNCIIFIRWTRTAYIKIIKMIKPIKYFFSCCSVKSVLSLSSSILFFALTIL